ncbi:MAG: thioredoxin-like domain-containing protein [Bacteroidota bacterium]|nr:thioredoxin-like domain-containing protein [Bacteroidota bacterium]
MRSFFSALLVLSISVAAAQESNGGKKLWAKSILNQKAPELIVQEWLTKVPDTRGKFVLIDFSATWCHACRKAMPELNDFQKKFADKLVVIFVTKETPEKVRAAKNFLVEVATAVDTFNRSSKLLEVKGIPHNLLIDPKRYVRWEGFPATKDFELTEEVLVSLFEKYSADSRVKTGSYIEEKVLSEPSVKGNVSSVAETNYSATGKEDDIQKGALQNRKVSLFNADGKLVEESFSNSGDTLVSKSTSRYDAKGMPAERNYYNGDDRLYSKATFRYDQTNRLLEEKIFDTKGDLDCRSSLTYNGNGYLDVEKLFNAKGKLDYKSVYKYDIRNNLVEKNIYDPKGRLASRYVAGFDDKGKVVEELVYGPSGMVSKYVHSYDKNGNKTEDRVYGPDGLLSSTYTYVYDANSNMIEERVNNPEDSLVIKYNYSYDNKGNKTETYRYDPNGELYLQSNHAHNDNGDKIVWDYYNQGKLSTKFINQYEDLDEMGNWEKRIKMANGQPNNYAVRETKYYNVLAKDKHGDYLISGTTDLEKGIAILNDYHHPDTTQIVDGKFYFKGQASGYTMISISVPPSRSQRIIIEPGNITVTHSSKDGYTLGGSQLNENFQKIEDGLKPISEKITKLGVIYNKSEGTEHTRLWRELDQLGKEKKVLLKKLVTTDKSYAGFMQCLTVTPNETASNVKHYLDLFREFRSDSRYQRLLMTYEGMASTDFGVQPPGWNLPDENGKMISLASLKGKYVLLDFWYSGCHWCRKMTPHLIKIYNDFKDKGFEIVSLSVDPVKDEDKWRKAMKEDGAPWLQVWDHDKTLPNQYAVWGYPTMFFLGPDGKVLQKVIGYHDEPILRSFFEEHMFKSKAVVTEKQQKSIVN